MCSEKMFTFSEICQFREETAKIGYCDETVDYLYNKLYGQQPWEELLVVEDWEDSREENGLSYAEYCTFIIAKQLKEWGCCFVSLANSSGEDKTFIHTFVLFATEDGIYRMESYGSFGNPNKADVINYCTRVIGDANYKENLEKLIVCEPGVERLGYWNELFSAGETCDTEFGLDIILRVREK